MRPHQHRRFIQRSHAPGPESSVEIPYHNRGIAAFICGGTKKQFYPVMSRALFLGIVCA